MQARYYDPVIGRFLSNDPVGFAEGGVEFFNRYRYANGNPVNLIDPTGLCAIDAEGNEVGLCGNGDAAELVDSQIANENSIASAIDQAAVREGVRVGVNTGVDKSVLHHSGRQDDGDATTIDLAPVGTESLTLQGSDGTTFKSDILLDEKLEHELDHIFVGLGGQTTGDEGVISESGLVEKYPNTRNGRRERIQEPSAVNRTNIYRRNLGRDYIRPCYICN